MIADGILIVSCVVLGLGVWEGDRWDTYLESVIRWCDEREKLFQQMYTEAEVVTAIPDHTSEFALAGGPTGEVTHRGSFTTLNYATLKSMFDVMLSQENARREYVTKLKNSMWRLQNWEKVNPLPKRPRFTAPWHQLPA